MMILADLSNQVGTIAGSEIAGDHIGHATMNPTSNGRAGNIQLGEQISVPRLADGLLNPIVVAPPRLRRLHLQRIGEFDKRADGRWGESECPAFSERCNCDAWTPE